MLPGFFVNQDFGERARRARSMIRDIVASYPLSHMQEGMLFNSLYAPGSGVEVQQIACSLTERVDPDALRRAWEVVVARQPLLRTAFSWDDRPMQHVAGTVDLPWRVEDRPCADTGEQWALVEEFLTRDRDVSFDLTVPPPMRLTLLVFSAESSCLVWTFHHALLDGRSFAIVLEEVFDVYDGRGAEGREQPPVVPPFSEFVAWQRSKDYTESRGFWRETLSGFSMPTPVPCDTGGAGGEAGHDEAQVVFSATESAALRRCAKEQGVSLNTLYQACWAMLLSRMTAEEDVAFGAIRACRHDSVPGAESMIGVFINLLPVRVRVDPDALLGAFLQELRRQQTLVRPYEHLPLAEVQALSEIPHGTPLFHSMMVFENASLQAKLRAKGGPWAGRSITIRSQTGYPLTLAMYGDEEILLKIEYERRRFARSTIERILGRARIVLNGMAEDPSRRLGDVPWMTEAEQGELLALGTASRTAVHDACLHSLFEEQARKTPVATAVSMAGERWTYDQLNRRANRLAHRLIALGVNADTPVGVCIERSPAMITAMFAVLKAGGAYVPLDPASPPDHIARIVRHAGIMLIVRGAGPTPLPPGVTTLEVDAGDGNDENPGIPVSTRSLAYIIYTSGTTGVPKGVMVEHRSVVNYIMTLGAACRFGSDDTLLQFASFSFDASAEEIYGALLHGATLALRVPGMLDTFTGFLDQCAAMGITVLDLPTAFWHQLVDALAPGGPALPSSTRLVLIGGEAASRSRLERWRRCVSPSVRLINTYGPTETTIVATTYDATGGVREGEGARDVPIGRPVANCRAYVLDARRRVVPVGVPGELAIGGACLARGYLGDPGLTAAKFIPDPFDGEGKMYCTGDLVRWLPGGVLEFLGRRDHQVKIRGFRIEPGEVEAAIRESDVVRDVVVVGREDRPGDRRLVAYCIFNGGAREGEEAVRSALRRRLPEYMVPSAFVGLDRFPSTPAGKVDRTRLPLPGASPARAGAPRDVPGTQVEASLARMFEETLGRESVGMEENFFDSGGHSLLAMQLLSRIRHAWSVRVTLDDLFGTPTVRALAALIEARLLEEIERMSDEDVARMNQ